MVQEWYAKCKDCGTEFGYSDSSYQLSNQRGLSRPERCSNCRKLHSREIANLGLSHFELTPLRPIPATGLQPSSLGGLIRPKRVHELRQTESTFDFDRFGIKDQNIREYFALMQKHPVTVIVAPTGSGKSTLLPYRLMVPPSGMPPDLFTRQGQIVVTQPRIQATRNIPSFVACDLHGSSLGAGFDVGFRHSGNPATDWRNKLVYMTDGTLINMIVRNEIGRLSVIMIDEAHERSLNIDLILGLLKVQLPRYPHLKLIIASATIDTRLFLEYYGGPEGFDPDQYKQDTDHGAMYDNAAIAQHLASSPVGFYGFPGKRQHPVETRFHSDDPIPFAQMPGQMPDEVAKKVYQVLRAMVTDEEPTRGDILAFLHGEKPIERAVATIRELVEDDELLAGKVDVLPLYTKLPQKQQDAALKPKKDKSKWRVVVSTNVAETSLTVEGIVHVVDSGLINESKWDPQTQTEYVVPQIHSRAGCIQRWGRAGRIQPGIAHCLYTEEQFHSDEFPAHTDPEIKRAPLEQIVLTAKAAGVDDIKNFNWIQRPNEIELDRVPHFLRQIGALDSEGDLTEHGLELRNFADETDIANLMILADRFGCAVEMATLIPMRKLGGYTSFLLWDKSWDAPTKRAVHQLHQGLICPCLDDLEFCLKLWQAWDGNVFGRKTKGERAHWASHFFVNHAVFQDKIMPEREALLASLSGHKKDEQVRPIDFNLLTRLRILMAYGLSNQIYKLANPPEPGQDMVDVPIYQPYIANPESNPELVKLHAEATVEISPESICLGQIPDYFVCGKRQRIRKRISPQSEPITIITAAFLTLIKPEWLEFIGQPPIAVARLIATTIRDEQGHLLPTTTQARLFLDQSHPVGAVFECHPTSDGVTVRLGPLKAKAPKLRASSSYEEVEDVEEIEILEAEGALSETAGANEKARRVTFTPDEEDETPLWADMIEDDEFQPKSTYSTLSPPMTVTGFPGCIVHTPEGISLNEPVLARVVGYDFTNRQQPIILVDIITTPSAFDLFQETYHEGEDITVEVVSIERYVSDWLLYLVIREVKTGLEIVMDAYDASLIGRNFAIDILQAGLQFKVIVEEINQKAQRVRVNRLKASEEAMMRFMGRENERMVEAKIIEVRDNGLYLWLDPGNTYDNMPCGAFVHLSRLPQRPDEMVLGKTCRVKVGPRQWKKNLRRSISIHSLEFEKKLKGYPWGGNLEWDTSNHTITVKKRITYEQRRKLLTLSNNGEYRRTINILFRRSNELDVRVLDITGLENLTTHQAQNTPIMGKVVSVLDEAVFVALPDGLEVPVPKHEVVYDRSLDLHQVVKEGEERPITIKHVDLEQAQAELSLLDPNQDPLNDFYEGQEVEGHVINILDHGALVELIPGVQGVVNISELAWWHVERVTEVVHRGQAVTVRILTINRKKRRLELTMLWPENDPLNSYFEDQDVQGRVTNIHDYGAFVELEPGVEGLVHISELAWWHVEQITDMIQPGQVIKARILALNREERRLDLTMRLPENDPLNKYHEDQEIQGHVIELADFGAFVEIEPGVQGLIHVSQLTWGHVKKVADMVQPGQVVKARILKINRKERHLDLTMRSRHDPLNDYHVGQTVRGRVTKLMDYGAFIEISPGVEGLVRISELSWGPVSEAADVVYLDQIVQARILRINREKRQLDLTLRLAENDPLHKYYEGQEVWGHVVELTNFGAFIELEPGVQGLVHIGELAWRRVQRVSDVVYIGQTVRGRILTIEQKNRRISLTMRLPESDPLNNYEVGQQVSGKVTGFTKDSKGAFVELEPGVEGFLYKDEISIEPVTDARQALFEGQHVVARITELNKVGRKLRLTIRGLYEANLIVPSSRISFVIGKGGSTIKNFMRTTQTYIRLDDSGACLIQGTTSHNVWMAEQKIRDILNTHIVIFTLQERQVPMLIGKGGSTIQGIQQRIGAQVDVENGQVTVIAADDYILRQVLSEIEAVISYCEITIQVSPDRVRYVIGKGGSTVKSIREQTGTYIDIAKDNSGYITIKGKGRYEVERAVQLVQAQASLVSYVGGFNEGTLPAWSEV